MLAAPTGFVVAPRQTVEDPHGTEAAANDLTPATLAPNPPGVENNAIDTSGFSPAGSPVIPLGTEAQAVVADEGIATDHTTSPFKAGNSPASSDSDSGRDSNSS